MKFKLETVEVERRACLNHLSNKFVCLECVSSCPTEAIKIKNKIPVINHLRCIDCGTCVSKCKILAIDHVQKPYGIISNEIKKHPNLNITCEQLVRYQKGIKISCYLYMDISLILQQSHGKDHVNFYTEQCNTCPKADFVSVESHVAMLQKELEELQIPITIKLINAKLDDNTYDQPVNGLSRRELLQQFSIKKMRESILDKKGEQIEAKKIFLSLAEKAKFKRQLFNNYLSEYFENLNTKKVLPSKDFLMLSVSDDCNGCNVCESVCPTKAIKLKTNLQEGRLLFSVHDCIGCRKCSVCPKQAINFHSIEFNSYQDLKQVELIKFKVKRCQKCGEQFRPKEDENLCLICDRQQNKDANQFFAHYLE